MLANKNYKFIREYLLPWPILLLILCIAATSMLRYWNYIEFVRPISDRMDIDNIEALERYMDETFTEGMSREAVHKELAKFGDYKSNRLNVAANDKVCEKIEYPTGNNTILFIGSRLEYVFCYGVDTDTFLYWTIFS